MRAIATSFIVVGCLSAGAAAAQSTAKPATGKPAIRACSLLTRDLAAKYGTHNPKMLELFKPEEEAIGAHGSSCNDGGIFLQVDPFVQSDNLRKSPAKDWQPVAGVGDTAFFHDNRGRYAELIVWSGSHHFTLQMNVPDGKTAESVKPNATGLAMALLTKLKAY
jgi:hypothetical protein